MSATYGLHASFSQTKKYLNFYILANVLADLSMTPSEPRKRGFRFTSPKQKDAVEGLIKEIQTITSVQPQGAILLAALESLWKEVHKLGKDYKPPRNLIETTSPTNPRNFHFSDEKQEKAVFGLLERLHSATNIGPIGTQIYLALEHYKKEIDS